MAAFVLGFSPDCSSSGGVSGSGAAASADSQGVRGDVVNGEVRLDHSVRDHGRDALRGRQVGAVGRCGGTLAGGPKLVLGWVVLQACSHGSDRVLESARPCLGRVERPEHARQLLHGDLSVEDRSARSSLVMLSVCAAS